MRLRWDWSIASGDGGGEIGALAFGRAKTPLSASGGSAVPEFGGAVWTVAPAVSMKRLVDAWRRVVAERSR